MNYDLLFQEAINKNEVILFLRGSEPYKIENSQYSPGLEPTDVGKVLSRAIYRCYKNNIVVKNIFENALAEMLTGSAYDVYMVILYILNQMFKEKNDIAPFELNKEELIPKLRYAIKNNKEELSNDIKFPDGIVIKGLWNRIERFNKVCESEYEFSLL